MKFQVFVPPLTEEEFALTFQVEAKDWMAALRQIVMRISSDGKMISNLMCDVKEDNTFHVTDPKSGRVFQVKAADEGAGAAASKGVEVKLEPKAAAAVESAAQPTVAPVAAKAAMPSRGALEATAAPPAAPPAAPATAGPAPAKEDFSDLEKTGPQQIGRAVTDAEWNAEELLAQVFEEIQDLYTLGEGTSIAARFALDLALKHVRCESGAVLLSDFKAKELAFAAASGPKAREVLSFRVPMGQGIAGFCAQEGVTLAVSAVEKDPRFFKKIADALGYETKSILCAPIVANGKTVGVVEVLNRYLSSSFAPAEVNVLSYIASRLGEHLGESA